MRANEWRACIKCMHVSCELCTIMHFAKSSSHHHISNKWQSRNQLMLYDVRFVVRPNNNGKNENRNEIFTRNRLLFLCTLRSTLKCNAFFCPPNDSDFFAFRRSFVVPESKYGAFDDRRAFSITFRHHHVLTKSDIFPVITHLLYKIKIPHWTSVGRSVYVQCGCVCVWLQMSMEIVSSFCDVTNVDSFL